MHTSKTENGLRVRFSKLRLSPSNSTQRSSRAIHCYRSTFILILAIIIAIAPAAIVYSDSPWHSKLSHINYFKNLASAHPDYISYQSVGKTYEGEDILMFKIGNPEGGRILWDAQLHGNEDYGSEILRLIGDWLFSGDAKAQRILERNYVLIIPVINIDSYDRSNANKEQTSYGVNLNRNFKTGWQPISASSDQNYSGPYAASENETQTIRDALDAYRPAFYVNLHQGSTNAPWARYYTGGESNNALSQQAVSRINDLGSQMGVTPFPMGTIGSTGFAVGDAGGEYGASAWLVEVDPRWTHTDAIYQDLVSSMYPKSLLMFIAMCELCEVEDAWSPEDVEVNILSGGSINYALPPPPPPSSAAFFGWGGFVRTYDSVIPMLDQLEQDGWNIVRYYSVPQWAQAIGYGGFDINHNILRHLTEEAKNRDMYVLLNIAHNFPPGPFIDGHQDDWINEYLADLQAINAINYDNLLFDLANEYTGTQSNIIAHYNAMIAALRDAGYTQTCLLSYWWNHDIGYCTSQVVDPLDNFMIGMHFYAQSNDFDDYDTPGTFTEVCQNSGIEDYFQNWLWHEKVQPVLDQGVEFLCGEIGSGWDYKYTRGGVAFPMRFIQLAQEDDRVHVIMHSAPNCCYDYDDYYGKAQQYWGEEFFTP